MAGIFDFVLLHRQISVIDALGDFEPDPLCELVKLKVVLLGLNIHRVDGVVDSLKEFVHYLLDKKVRLVHDHGKH